MYLLPCDGVRGQHRVHSYVMAHLRPLLAKKLGEVWCFVKSILAMNLVQRSSLWGSLPRMSCIPSSYKSGPVMQCRDRFEMAIFVR